MQQETVYTPDMFPEFEKTEYYYQFVENRQLSPVVHRHEFYEIFMILQGWAIQNVNGRPVTMNPGEVMILSPRDTHCFVGQSDEMTVLGISVLSSRFCAVVNAFGLEPDYGKAYSFSSGRFSREQLFRLAGKPEKKKILLNTLLCEIFLKLADAESEEKQPIPLFLRDGYARLAEPKNIGQGMGFLVAHTCYSRSQLCRLTVQYYGKTPTDMIREIRLNLAKEYLRNSNDTLETIAERIGYRSVSQLHKVFRECCGESPGSYRKRSRYYG